MATKKSSRTNAKKKNVKSENNGFYKELVIWITLLVSIILILCVFNLCGPLSNVFGAFLFGMFGFLAYLFPVLLFFTAGFYMMNKDNKKVVGRIIASWGLYIIIVVLLQLFKGDIETNLLHYYIQGYTDRTGGGFIGGLISTGLKTAMGTFATTIVLIIISFILVAYISGKFIASMILDKSTERYNEIREAREADHKKADKPAKENVPKQKKKRITYTFPTDEQVVIPTEGQGVLPILEQTEEPEEERHVEVPIYQKEIDEKFGREASERNADKSLDELIKRATFVEDDNDIVASVEQSLAGNIEAVMEDINNSEDIVPAKEDNVPADKKEISAENATENADKGISGETLDIVLPPEPIKYEFPPLSLLQSSKKSQKGMTDKELKDTAIRLRECLKSFKVDVTITDIICGPTVTRYELLPALGTRVKKITELENDIKLNLAAKDIRIEAPIPGKSAVGIEVPNSDKQVITLRDILESNEFKEHKSLVSFGTGKDIGGRNIVADIETMPHLLIAGSTGSGKSVCINTIVMSILYKADPNDVKLIMIDPKVVELSIYNGIPHLCIPVVTDPKKAAAALNWGVAEMNDRYNKFAELGTKDMKGYNKKVATMKNNPNMYVKMPQIVIIVDELADLMMVASHDVENAICRLAQKARAAGIHLIIATQRPSVDVITGLIKANIPSRIAFAVTSSIDSRTILDASGAEKLLGKGDMLFAHRENSKPLRVQGAFVSEGEVTKVTSFVKGQYDAPVYDATISEKIEKTELTGGKGGNSTAAEAEAANDDGHDDLFYEAGKFIISKQKASIGTLQRVFKIGFNRGARIMDQLCEAGVVSEEDGKKPRNILMTLEEFEQLCNEGR